MTGRTGKDPFRPVTGRTQDRRKATLTDPAVLIGHFSTFYVISILCNAPKRSGNI